MIQKTKNFLIGRSISFCLFLFISLLSDSCSHPVIHLPENIQFLQTSVNLLYNKDISGKTKSILNQELKNHLVISDSFGIQLSLKIAQNKTIWVNYFFEQETLRTMNISIIDASQAATLNTWQSIVNYYNACYGNPTITQSEYLWIPEKYSKIIIELFPVTNEIKMTYLFNISDAEL